MSELEPVSSPLFVRVTRRGLALGGAASLASAAIARAVAGHDDHDDHDDDDDSGSGRGRGRGGDDDEVQPLGTAPAGSAEVRITDDDADAFEPGTITIDAGGSVTWINLDDDPHTATGADFDTGTLQPGELATIVFDEPGEFRYSCQFHPEMTGTVAVRDEAGNVPAAANADANATPAASPQATPTGNGQQSAVSIIDLAFDPETLDVSVGTTVTWTNDEAIPHTVTSTDDVFGSDILEQGDTFTHVFDTPGTFDYICNLHPSMQGTITVTE